MDTEKSRDRGMVRTLVLLICWDPEPIEMYSGATAALWGLWLLLPIRSMQVCTDVYTGMLKVMPGAGWGILLLSGGLLQVAGVVTAAGALGEPARWQRIWRLRQWTCLLSFVTWSFVAVTFATGAWKAPILPLYCILAVTSALTYIRLRAAAFRPGTPG